MVESIREMRNKEIWNQIRMTNNQIKALDELAKVFSKPQSNDPRRKRYGNRISYLQDRIK